MTIEERVLAFVRAPGDESEFLELALAVFAHQQENVPVYHRFCQRRGVDPDRVRRWQDIPALPADAFKLDLEPTHRPHVFTSSGTAQGPERRSRHAISSLVTYRASALAHFRAMVLPDGAGPFDVAVLGPTAATHPHSSLGQMFSWCADEFAGERVFQGLDADGRFDLDAALEWIAARADGTTPVLVLAVSSALTAVLEALRDRRTAVRLPAESRVVDTGGRKGRGHVLSPAGLLKACWSRLHVPAYLCVNEYGMTEMLSQFYDDALESRVVGRLSPRAKVGPAWVRTVVVDPATLEPLPPGAVGLLRHLDLANWESVSALQTLDLGRQLGRGFEHCGRARGAEARGCSVLLAEIREDDVRR
jgi:hypothetical protein